MADEVKPTRDELILKAKELYSKGSRNYLLKCYSESADELSEVCALYEEIYGELSDELGMPYLLYAKSLIALAFDENKVIDVPDEEDDDDEDDEDEDNENAEGNNDKTAKPTSDQTVKPTADQSKTEAKPSESTQLNEKTGELEETKEPDSTADKLSEKQKEETADSTVETQDKKTAVEDEVVTSTEDPAKPNGSSANGNAAKVTTVATVEDDQPSTSNGQTEAEEDIEVESSLQLAWEILELAAKIFTRQGLSGLPNLAEVQTELANIEFENNILDSAREDYGKALQIYENLTNTYRRAMAEIHYKIGLTYLMQQMNQEGAESLKQACALIEDEINEMKAKENLTDKDDELIKDMEETKQEIWAKIAEIEETRQQNMAEVRAALDSFIGPAKDKTSDGAGPSSSASSSSSAVASSSAITSSSKPTDISHLIKRKKPDTPSSSEAEAAASPAKKPAV